jgi:hypothetical protein
VCILVIQAKGGQGRLVADSVSANCAVPDRERAAAGGDYVRVDLGNHDAKGGVVAKTGRVLNHFVPAGQDPASTAY